jgi:hypothetical protein
MDEVVEKFEESRISLPIGQTKPGKANLFGQAEPSADRHDLYDGNGNRCYVTLAFVMARDRDGTIREREEFKIPGMTRQEWIRAQGKRYTLPFYAKFGLLAAPPLGKRCTRCAKEHGSEGDCVIGTEGGELPGAYAGGLYTFCKDKGKHAAKMCPTLNRRCPACLFKGHDKETGRCGQVAANLATFKTSMRHGYVTSNRTRDFGAANGYYPIIRLAQLHYVSALGRYVRMLTLHPNSGNSFTTTNFTRQQHLVTFSGRPAEKTCEYKNILRNKNNLPTSEVMFNMSFFTKRICVPIERDSLWRYLEVRINFSTSDGAFQGVFLAVAVLLSAGV